LEQNHGSCEFERIDKEDLVNLRHVLCNQVEQRSQKMQSFRDVLLQKEQILF